jgi:nucleotide-binding universal stress UspA family protein
MKSILVHIDASPRAAVRLLLAQRIAHQHAARLTALYGVTPSLLSNPWAAGEGMAPAAAMAAELDREQRQRARSLVQQATAGGLIEWVDAGEAPYGALLQHLPYHDLLVLGQTDSRDTLTGALPPALVPSALADGGLPALVVPSAGAFDQLGSRVLIAWKPTREATRAVHAAVPFLRAAAQVDVALRPEGGDSTLDHGAALSRWLRLQGVTAPVRLHTLGPAEVGESLLSLAADTGAGLLVMGCYGHGRAREWVLGGASRTVLASMTLPVLMAH